MARQFDLTAKTSFWHKAKHLDWLLVMLIGIVAIIGFLSLYAAANGNLHPWASRQMLRFAIGFVMMIAIAFIDIRFWLRVSYLCFGVGLLLLLFVEIAGHIGMGAQRWIDLGFMKLQPSEIMKIGVIMALARYFHTASKDDMKRIFFLFPAALIILVPVGLVLLQPDLGTSLMIILAGVAVVFISGAPLWIFIGGIVVTAASIPIAWHFMHDYQRQRVMTFLHPESDPLGSGYHITQSKIALGSGGLDGKGFLQGTQSRLNFLPEKQTDFIFTLWAEEWGFIGGIVLLAIFACIFAYCGWISLTCRYAYGKILAFGLMVNFSLYVFVNIAMVMGLIPVVGAPLPLISYGGTAMLSAMVGFGLVMSCSIHKDSKLPRM